MSTLPFAEVDMKTWLIRIYFYCACTKDFRCHEESFKCSDSMMLNRLEEIIKKGFVCDISEVIKDFDLIYVAPNSIFSILVKEV